MPGAHAGVGAGVGGARVQPDVRTSHLFAGASCLCGVHTYMGDATYHNACRTALHPKPTTTSSSLPRTAPECTICLCVALVWRYGITYLTVCCNQPCAIHTVVLWSPPNPSPACSELPNVLSAQNIQRR